MIFFKKEKERKKKTKAMICYSYRNKHGNQIIIVCCDLCLILFSGNNDTSGLGERQIICDRILILK